MAQWCLLKTVADWGNPGPSWSCLYPNVKVLMQRETQNGPRAQLYMIRRRFFFYCLGTVRGGLENAGKILPGTHECFHSIPDSSGLDVSSRWLSVPGSVQAASKGLAAEEPPSSNNLMSIYFSAKHASDYHVITCKELNSTIQGTFSQT